MKKKVSIALIFVLMLSCLTACGGGGESTASGESSVAAEETKQTEKISAKGGSGDRVFERDLNRTIPEGYEEVEWDKDSGIPVEVMEEYTKIENPKTEMVGLVTYDGKIVVEPEYSNLYYMWSHEGEVYFGIKYEGKTGVINSKGEETVKLDKMGAITYYENRMLRFETNENSVTCISYDITTGEKLGSFDVQTTLPDLVIGETIVGPNGWICPVGGDSWDTMHSLGIVNPNGEKISNTEFGILEAGGSKTGLNLGYSMINGLSCQMVNEGGENKYGIVDENGNVVSQLHDYAIPYRTYGNAFLLYDMSYVVFDTESKKEYEINDFVKDDRLYGVFDEGMALYEPIDEENAVALRNLETGKTSVIIEDGDVERCYIDTNRFLYESNDTYKLADLEGNLIGEDRYYDMYEAEYYDFQTFDGVFLKQENGDWVYVDGDGNISKETGLFRGDEDAPTTYNDLPIVGFWEYEGTPCVVVEEDDKQVGYAL